MAGLRRSRLMSRNINQVHQGKNPNYLMILQKMLVAPKYKLGRWKSLRRLLDKMKNKTLLWDYRIGSITNIILISHLKKRKMKTMNHKVREMKHALKDQISAKQVVVLIPNSTQSLLTHQQKRSNLTNQRESRRTSWSDQRARVTQRHWHQTLIPMEESIKASHPWTMHWRMSDSRWEQTRNLCHLVRFQRLISLALWDWDQTYLMLVPQTTWNKHQVSTLNHRS